MSEGTVIKKYNRILEFSSENCVGCGICEKICPKGAVTIYRKNDRFEAMVSERCVVCGICADLCFYGAMKHEGSVYREIMEEIGFRKGIVDEKLCILCGLCMRECPRGAIKVLRRIDLKKLRRGSLKIKEGCIDCKLCLEVCPTNAINIKNSKLSINEERCIYCEMCSRICPMNVIEVMCDSCRNLAEKIYALDGKVIFDEQACSMCGICEEICPTKALKIAKLFTGEQRWFKEKCLYHCTVCRELCPNFAIEYEYIPDKIVKFNQRCNFCGTCEKFCSGEAIKIERTLPSEFKIDFRETKPVRKKLIRVKSKDLCSGCGICTSYCPLSKEEIIEIVNGSVLEKEAMDCIACGLCVKICPEKGLELFEIPEKV